MSVNGVAWYYRKAGLVEDETVGPLSEDEIADLIRRRKIKDTTLLVSPQATGNQWMALSTLDFRAALARLDAKAKEVQRREEERKRKEDERLAAERQAAAQSANAQSSASHVFKSPPLATPSPLPLARPTSSIESPDSVTQSLVDDIVGIFTFKTFILPALVRVIHALVVFVGVAAVGGITVLAVINYFTTRGAGAEVFVFPLMTTGIWILTWLAVRISLESIMIVFRIEEHLRKE